MNIITTDDVKFLIDKRESPCISLFMPTHRKGKEIEQDPIRFKNLLRLAEERIVERGFKTRDAEEILAPAYKLQNNKMYWKHQSDGLAVFAGKDIFREYRVPSDFDELAVVTDRFHIKPVLPLISGDGRFYILVFSVKSVRLLQGSHFSVGEIDLEGLPTSLAETLDLDRYQKQLQFHTGTPSRGSKRDAVFHGHGDAESDEKELIHQFFLQLDKGLRELLEDESAPLVLAGVDYIYPIFREASKYPHIVEGVISGNQDETSHEELHNKAWPLVEPIFKKGQERAWQKYRELTGAGNNQASNKIEEIIPAAAHGRIETLFVARNLHCWGSFDEESNKVSLHEREQIGGQDLLDFAAVATYSQKGVVYVVPKEQLEGEPMAAVMRY